MIAQLRNDQHHGSVDAGPADRDLVFRTIEVCAHRFLSTPFTIGSDARMRYVNNRLEVTLKEHRGRRFCPAFRRDHARGARIPEFARSVPLLRGPNADTAGPLAMRVRS